MLGDGDVVDVAKAEAGDAEGLSGQGAGGLEQLVLLGVLGAGEDGVAAPVDGGLQQERVQRRTRLHIVAAPG